MVGMDRIGALACGLAMAVVAFPWQAFAASPTFVPAEVGAQVDVQADASAETWGLESIYAPEAWEKLAANLPAEGTQPVCVAVIDTGFYADHPDLAPYVASVDLADSAVAATWDVSGTSASVMQQILSRPALVEQQIQSEIPQMVTPPSAFETAPDEANHGTHVAGIVSAVGGNGSLDLLGDGTKTAVRLMLVKAAGDDGTVSEQALCNAFDLIMQLREKLNVRVVNMSIGDSRDVLPEESALYAKIDAAYEAGIVTVCSAGNEGATGANFPGDYATAVSVMGLVRAGQGTDAHNVVRAPSYSNYNPAGSTQATGPKNICAPGTAIYSATGQSGHGYQTGTSQAAAFVSGVFALMFTANPVLSAEEAVNRLYETAIDLGDEGWDAATGYGEANALGALDPTATPPSSGGTGSGESGNTGNTGNGSGSETGSGNGSGNNQNSGESAGSGKGSGGNAGNNVGSGSGAGAESGGAAKDSAGSPASPALAQTLKLAAKAKTVKYSQVKKKPKTIARPFTVKGNKGKLSYKKLSGNKKITVNPKTGKLTIKKGIKKNKKGYRIKIQVTAAATPTYKSADKAITATVKVI